MLFRSQPLSAPERGTDDLELLGSAIAAKPVTRTAAAKPQPEPAPPVATTTQTATDLAPPAPVANSRSWRSRKKAKAVHPELQLETVTKGPFEHSKPTLRNGVDLDVPTFVRRGMTMN